MMKKVALYIISKCPQNSSDDEFNKNICSIVSSKKQIKEFIINKSVLDHKEHYNQWLINHMLPDNISSRKIYFSLVIDDLDSSAKNYCFKKNIYTIDGIASIFRMFNKCEPVGCSYEHFFEYDYYNSFVQECLENINTINEKIVDSENK